LSYDPKYREWVEIITDKKEAEGSSKSNELYQVYRGIPVIRVKVRDNPPLYRFVAPVVTGRARDFERLREKIDQQLNKTKSPSIRYKVSRKDVADKDSDEVTYFQKWQDCQVELEYMKRREKGMVSKLEELEAKMNELSAARTHLQKEVADLKNQLKASQALISDLNKKK
jgi:hypothetical protein